MHLKPLEQSDVFGRVENDASLFDVEAMLKYKYSPSSLSTPMSNTGQTSRIGLKSGSNENHRARLHCDSISELETTHNLFIFSEREKAKNAIVHNYLLPDDNDRPNTSHEAAAIHSAICCGGWQITLARV